MARFIQVTNYHYCNSRFGSDGVIYVNPEKIVYYRQVYSDDRANFYPYYWVYLDGWSYTEFKLTISKEDLNKCLRAVGSPEMR